MVQRVLYFAGHHMLAQEWNGSRLVTSLMFKPDDRGLDLFSAYLKSLHNRPFSMLVDLIAEEFRMIEIPLLHGSDRKSLLNRHFNRFFRHSEFRYAVKRGVEKKTRKEEKILLIGITNASLLEPWLKIIAETRASLRGIISLPLLSEHYVASLKPQDDVVILVSQGIADNLRQSVFIGGKLLLSRLVPISSFDQGDYASDVIADVGSTQRYLVNQQTIETGDQVSVHLLTNTRHYAALVAKCAEAGRENFHVHEIDTLLQHRKIRCDESQALSTALFCHLAAQKKSLNHYALNQQKKYYHHYVAAQSLKLAAIAVFAISLGFSTLKLSTGFFVYSNTIPELSRQTKIYQEKIDSLKKNEVNSSISSLSIQDTVRTVEDIQNGFIQDPEELLSLISESISMFPDIRVQSIDWFVSDISAAKTSSEVNWSVSRQSSQRRQSTSDALGEHGFFEIANVAAALLNFDGDYRSALSLVDALEKSMRRSDDYFDVLITKRPYDIEPSQQLSGNAGTENSASIAKAEFAFRVIRKVKGSG